MTKKNDFSNYLEQAQNEFGKLMRVKDVIRALSQIDPEMIVASYSSDTEDMSLCKNVKVESVDGKQSYTKGDHVLYLLNYKDPKNPKVKEVCVIG